MMTVPCGGPGAPISAINAVCAGTTLHVALVFSAYVPVAVSDIRGALEADDDFASLMELLRAEPLEENINMTIVHVVRGSISVCCYGHSRVKVWGLHETAALTRRQTTMRYIHMIRQHLQCQP